MSFCGIVCRCVLSKHTTCKFSSARAGVEETFFTTNAFSSHHCFSIVAMKKITAKVFSLHSWLGIFAGAFMILIGLTGSLLVFTDDINDALYHSWATVEPQGRTKSYDALIADIRRQLPDAKILRLTSSEKPDHAYTAIVQEGSERLYAYLNPYTGDITGKIEVHSRFTNWLIRLHFTLLMRPWGDVAVALVGFSFIGLSITGLWIQRKSLFNVYTKAIRWKAGAKVASHDLHLLTGSASVAFCIVMAVSGFYMMLYTLDMEWWQKQLAARKTVDEKRVEAKPSAFTLSADSLLNVSKNLIEEFEPKIEGVQSEKISLSLSHTHEYAVAIVVIMS